MTVEEVAAIIKLSAATVRRMPTRGISPAGKLGIRQWRISVAALAVYMEGGQRFAPKGK